MLIATQGVGNLNHSHTGGGYLTMVTHAGARSIISHRGGNLLANSLTTMLIWEISTTHRRGGGHLLNLDHAHTQGVENFNHAHTCPYTQMVDAFTKSQPCSHIGSEHVLNLIHTHTQGGGGGGV